MEDDLCSACIQAVTFETVVALCEQLHEALLVAERHCPCGARPESLHTHPHVSGCLIVHALETYKRVIVRPSRDIRQQRTVEWCKNAFGADHQASIPQRGIRLAEEAIETAQAAGCDAMMLHRLVDHVYSRPVGDLQQELGGVGITLLALAAAAGLSADDCERRELERIQAKPYSHFRARNAEKNAAGFDATHADPDDPLSPKTPFADLTKLVLRMAEALRGTSSNSPLSDEAVAFVARVNPAALSLATT